MSFLHQTYRNIKQIMLVISIDPHIEVQVSPRVNWFQSHWVYKKMEHLYIPIDSGTLMCQSSDKVFFFFQICHSYIISVMEWPTWIYDNLSSNNLKEMFKKYYSKIF